MKIKYLFLTALLLAITSISFAQSKLPTGNLRKQNNQRAVKLNISAAAAPVRRLGVFTNMRYTADHQSGTSVELWQENDRLFGFFLAAAGMIGDTPTGLLEDVVFNSKTGKLSFRAKLSTGSVFNKNNEQVPTRDVYQFTGFLKGQQLTGILAYTDALEPAAPSKKTKLTLRRSIRESASLSQAQSYEEWKKEADEILALRGPKW